jgi:hypothetical protein
MKGGNEREMPKKNLEILEYEDKTTKGGMNYVRFKTNEGWMSCFDKKSAATLKNKEGETVLCEVVQQGDFQNIKKYLGDADEDEQEERPAKQEKASQMPVRNNFDAFPVSMKVAYAKDLVIAGKEPKDAVEVVKFLIESFKEKPVEAPRNIRKELMLQLKAQPDFEFKVEDLPAQMKTTNEEITKAIKELADSGIIFLPKPGFVKYL